jgi:hypothetical protein
MYLAVFGDLHGHILPALTWCTRWQQETGQQLDLILQVGDLGIFPDRTRLDRATRRHSVHDARVLGFQESFTTARPEVVALLSTLRCDLLFVRGNHEDHAWLDTLEQQATEPRFPVDVYQRLWCLQTGVPFTLQQGNERLTILGIGRIGQPAAARRTKAHFIQPHEQRRLDQLGAIPIDLLLTHDAARDAIYPGSGSLEIAQALGHHRPPYHFFGHYGGPARSFLDANGITRSYKLADLTWETQPDRPGPAAGAMGILHWHNRHEYIFTLLEAS